jgi:hypothetical protein
MLSTRRWARVGIPAAALALLGGACSSGQDGGQSAGSSGSGGGAPLAQPPAPGPTKPAGGMGSVTLAVSKLFFGDTDRDGTPNVKDGWRQYGFDLDGQASTEASTGLCKPHGKALAKDVYPDGNDGIDNAFGKSILPIFRGIDSEFSTKVNADLTAGKSGTELFELLNLGPGADDNPLTGRYYAAAPLGKAPLFDGTDTWPVKPELLANPADINSTTVTFPTGYLVGNTWVGRPPGDMPLYLGIGGVPLKITIAHAVIAMELDAGHTSAKNGTIAGIVDAKKLYEALQYAAKYFDPSLCVAPPIDTIEAQIEEASDIPTSGAQDPSKECDGISIGLGFEAKIVKIGAVAAPDPPPPEPCSK